MSLLMDALKKAELAKRQGQAEGADAAAGSASAAGLSLEPLGSPGAAGEPEPVPGDRRPNPPSQSQLEELDAQFLAEAQKDAGRPRRPAAPAADATPSFSEPVAGRGSAPSPRAATAPRESPAQSAAQNLFSAKQAAAPSRKSFAVTVSLLTVVAIGAIGGYFWWQLQPKTQPLMARGAPPAAPTALPPPRPVAAAPAATAPVAVTPAPTPASGASNKTPADADRDDEDEKPAAKASARPTGQPQRAAPVLAAPQGADPERLLRVTKAPLKVNPSVMRGFDAFNRGDLDLARTEYERARKADPRNGDALHGLAAIAARQGNADQAEALYRQILEADPQDTIAAAALINSPRAQADPVSSESRLKILAANQPELAAPHFALGNLYARQGNWSEAQQAYFRAYSAEPENPDILYNLAISLEHLRQNKLAVQYYGLAIAAAQHRPAGFDPARLAARLATLQP